MNSCWDGSGAGKPTCRVCVGVSPLPCEAIHFSMALGLLPDQRGSGLPDLKLSSLFPLGDDTVSSLIELVTHSPFQGEICSAS